MSLSLSYASTVTVIETLADTDLASTAKSVTHSGNSTGGTINGSSSPPVTKRASAATAMSGGIGSIDLRALIGTNGIDIDGNGLRVQYIKLTNPATNANLITITKGASNGYDGLGADFSITLVPGAEFLMKLNDGGGDIGATNKILDMAGTGSQAIAGEIVMG